MATLQNSIEYIEDHLQDSNLTVEGLAKETLISSAYLQKGFSILTGFSVAEYIRNRRLYLAALDIHAGKKVIDVALDYGYDSPDSFTKAFTRFHEATPREIRTNSSKIKVFLPISFSIEIAGGTKMKEQICEMPAFRVIGIPRRYHYGAGYKEVPSFWEDHQTLHYSKNQLEAIRNYGIGTYGVCIDSDLEQGIYLIAGEYGGGEIPEGMEVFEIPAQKWAKFTCIGPLPGAIQAISTAIYKHWLPTNLKYELAAEYSVEWYSGKGKETDSDYWSEVWMPVKEKTSETF